jgi:hypothetical protein
MLLNIRNLRSYRSRRVIEADASRNHRIDGKLTALVEEERATRPVCEYLEALDRAAWRGDSN